MTILGIILLVAIIIAGYRYYQNKKDMNIERICTQCGSIGKHIKKTKGSFWIELVLWIAFIIPGLIYSIWRTTSKQSVCPKCGHSTMIPIDSPMGQKLAKEQNYKKAKSSK